MDDDLVMWTCTECNARWIMLEDADTCLSMCPACLAGLSHIGHDMVSNADDLAKMLRDGLVQP
jgi:hypothetical protein